MKDHFKVVFLGECGVGKTSILTNFVKKKFIKFSEPTIGASFVQSQINIDNRIIELDIWDTAGQERYRGLVPMYYRNANCIVLVYDVTHKESFYNTINMVYKLKTTCPNSLIFLVGNKSDLKEARSIEKKIGEDYSKQHDLYFFETSAKNSENIANLFDTIAKELSEIIILDENKDTIILMENTTLKKKCC